MISGSVFQTLSHFAMPIVRKKNPNILTDYRNAMRLVVTLGTSHILLANLAFTGYPALCESIFPCAITKIYSQTFASLPWLGLIIALYPAANIAPISMQAMSLN